MKVTVIIVNYNVKHFLEQCLWSLQDALKGLEAEVFVVDNNSTDGSIDYLRNIFPWVQYIVNPLNVGFAKANNQAIEIAKGEYILFLNPDTLVAADAISASISFMDDHPGAGALGIRMMDGSGRFLPESKRAFPSPVTSLFKLFGLSALFPKSKIFGRYHLGHLSQDGNHEVDVLAGAFMMVRNQVLKTVGNFDEKFFMYGEDVDLSYRIQKAGWKNYYFSGSSVIHFKGESTKKGSLNYVRMFYQAMSLFVDKHYSSGKAGFFRIFITLAIWFRAFLSAFARFIKWIGLPVMDILLTLASIVAIAWFWQHTIKPGIQYPPYVLRLVLPLFTFTFILAGGIAGLYDKWYRPGRAWVAMMIAVIFNLATYSLFDTGYRFSRGVILFGGILASIVLLGFRFILLKAGFLDTPDETTEHRQTLICGNIGDYDAVVKLMQFAGKNERILGRVALKAGEPGSAGSFSELHSLLKLVPAREIVFCISNGLRLADVMTYMQTAKQNTRYKFYYENSAGIVGSENSETSGEIISATEAFSIDRPENRRIKKIGDLAFCSALILFFPVHLFFVRNPAGLLRNIVQVIAGRKTWVGYCIPYNNLPYLPAAVLGCNGLPVENPQPNSESLSILDYWYAKDYEWRSDSRVLLKGYRYLGS
jgi:GT2 family glycosyltransferase